MAKLCMGNSSMLGPVISSQLPDDFDKHSKEEKVKIKGYAFFILVTGLKFPVQTGVKILFHYEPTQLLISEQVIEYKATFREVQ